MSAMLLCGPLMPFYKGSGITSNGDTNTIPTTCDKGDLIIDARQAGASPTPAGISSGFTSVITETNTLDKSLRVQQRIAASDDESVPVSTNASRATAAWYGNVDPISPIRTSGAAQGNNLTIMNWPSLSLDQGSVVVGGFGKSGASSLNLAAELTSRADVQPTSAQSRLGDTNGLVVSFAPSGVASVTIDYCSWAAALNGAPL